MTTYTLSGSFGWAGGGKAGAVVDVWATSRFAGFPVQGQAPPSGSPDAGPVTTGDTYGNPGGYLVSGITVVQDYYVRIQYGGQTWWGERTAASLGGLVLGGLVDSVMAGDASVVVAPNTGVVVVESGTLDQVANLHPPGADWSNNSHKITGVANGSAASDVAAFGQIPTSLPPSGAAGGDLTGTFPSPTLAAIGSATGPTGDGTHVAVVTIDTKGRVTALTSTAITGAPPSGSASGDLSGTYPGPTVAKLNGVAAASYALLASPALTGTPTAPTAAVGTNTTQLATTAFVQAGAPVNVLTTTFSANAYTLVLADENSAQQASNGVTAATVTVPTNASVAFPIGTVITFTQTGSGQIKIAAAGGVTIISSVSGGFVSGTTGCRVQNSTIGLLKTGTNAWTLSGDAA